MTDILIAAAVHEEVEEVVQQIEMPVASQVGGRKIISGCLEGIPVKVVVTRPGIVNTVQALTAAIENAAPSLIIQTGCAGAFKASGLEIGDIGIATEEIDVHLGIEPETFLNPHFSILTPLPFPLIKRDNLELKNRYPLNHDLAGSAFEIIRSVFDKKIHVRTGPFVTVSTITATDKRAESLYKQFGACMEAMEGSGAAHLAIHYQIPFLEIRAASNFVGKRERDSWNLPLAFERCGMAVIALIQTVKSS